MPIRLGSTAVTLKLGTQSVTGRLGSTLVTASVPGAPTIAGAAGGTNQTTVDASPPASDGGEAITSYEFTFDGVVVTAQFFIALNGPIRRWFFTGNYTGQAARVRAVNAVGAGAYSDPVTVEAT